MDHPFFDDEFKQRFNGQKIDGTDINHICHLSGEFTKMLELDVKLMEEQAQKQLLT